MSNLDMTAMNAALKELYDGQSLENLVYADNPFLALVKKNTDFVGKYKPIPIITGASQGRSAAFANAQANQSPVQIESFLLKRVTDYSIATIANETMLASKSDKGAFIDGTKTLIDGAIRSITLSLASAMFRSGTGSIGKIATASFSGAAGVITLSDITTVAQFEINMVLQANATDGGATPRAALGYVVGVDRALGTVTVSATGFGGSAASPTSWAQNDYLVIQGDNNAKISGLEAWLPTTAPSGSDNFFGVNRSVDVVRLAGVRYDGSSQSIEEALIDACNLVAREGGTPKICLTNYASFSGLEKALGAKVQYVDRKGPGEIGFRGIKINGASGVIDVFPDRNCPGLKAYLLQPDVWALESLGDAPQILRYGDGLEMLRVANSDAGEVRIGAYCNLSCRAPGWNANVTLGA